MKYRCEFFLAGSRCHPPMMVNADQPLEAAEIAARRAADVAFGAIEVFDGSVRLITWKRPPAPAGKEVRMADGRSRPDLDPKKQPAGEVGQKKAPGR